MPQRDSFKPVKFILLAVVALVVISLIRGLGAKDLIPWRRDLKSAAAEAQTANKPIFAYFTAVWCGPCQSLKRTTWSDEKVEAALRDYVPVKIDIDQHPDLAREYRVDSVPSFIVLSADQQPLRAAVGALPPEEFLSWLKG